MDNFSFTRISPQNKHKNMDTFGSAPNHSRALVKDTLTTTNTGSSQKPVTSKAPIKESKDSFTVSNRDISYIVDTIKANKITDIQSIKDYVTFKDAGNNFSAQNLTDHQWSKLVSAVRGNIAENLAEVIYSTKHNEKFSEISSKERAHIDNLLSRLRNSQVTNLSQAIDFVQQNSSDNPGLLSKISGRLVNIVHKNEQQSPFHTLRQDSYTPAFSIDPGKFSNPFKSDILTRKDQPRTVSESKDFLRSLMSNNPQGRSDLAGNQLTNADMSNLILANYLRGRDINQLPDDMMKKQITVEDQVWYHERMAHKKISFVNDVAAKVAANKAKVIITCRILGQVGGAAAGALGMASIAGASPLIGIVGAFALTLIASIAGFIIGKAAGEGLGKVVTNTSLELTTPEELEEYKRRIEEMEEDRERLNSYQRVEEEDDDDEDDDDYEEDSNSSTNFFNTIDTKVSEALRSRIFFNKK